MRVARGVTRTVVLTHRYALKLPGGYGRCYLRGWLANRSEWRQRKRRGVCRPVATFFHLVLMMPRADRVGHESEDGPWRGRRGDTGKASSWGLFGTRWLRIDYDLSWRVHRGVIGGIYFGWQEWRYGGRRLKAVLRDMLW